MRILDYDVVVIGSGVAGLTAALELAPRRVAVLTKGRLGLGGSSAWAQGGIAAAVGPGDSPALHAADTLAAGDGLNDPAMVELLTAEGPERVMRLIALGAELDRAPGGALALGQEAAHRRRRVLHAHGDATGAEVMRVLAGAVAAAPHVTVFEESFAWDLINEGPGGRIAGVTAVVEPAGGAREILALRAPAVVLASGGIGRLFSRTTNPVEVTGDGLAMAARAGARLADVEMVQFHPTALAAPGADPMPLLTEALRGEGAILVDAAGRRFMSAEHPDAELAPRDVVARAIARRLAAGDEVFLDARAAVGEAFPERFPTVFGLCRRHGIDPRRVPIPASPAVHYHMGGVAADAWGRTSLAGLWACGEAAATGAHGANRLASNSLLEGLVFGARVARAVGGTLPESPAPRLRLASERGEALSGRPGVCPAPPPAAAARRPLDAAGAADVARLRELAWRHAGVERSASGLGRLLEGIEEIAGDRTQTDRLTRMDQLGGEGHNLLLAGRILATAALAREESRGGHYRSDFPASDPAWRRRLYVELGADGAVRTLPGALLPERGDGAADVVAEGRG